MVKMTPTKDDPFRKYYFIATVIITSAILLLLSSLTYYINDWPTDSEIAYIPAARGIFSSIFISHLHQLSNIPFDILYGKEAMIVGISVLQNLLHDSQSLFPNVLLLILATCLSGILIYLIMCSWFNPHIGFLSFILFIFSFWPYQYILLGAHPPFALMNLLLAIYFLSKEKTSLKLNLLSGIFFGIMLFSSPTALIYSPYYAAVYVYRERLLRKNEANLREILLRTLATGIGILFIFLIFTLPDPLAYIKSFLNYVNASKNGNHFQIAQSLAIQNAGILPNRGGGILWLLSYIYLMIPVLFTLYLFSLIYLLLNAGKKPSLLWLIIVSLSTPLAVEAAHVAQFGRNYFSWLIGIIFIICYTIFSIASTQSLSFTKKEKRIALELLGFFVIWYIGQNVFVFTQDVFPSRMASSHLYSWLKQHPHKNIYALSHHPYNKNTIQVMNNIKLKEKIKFGYIENIAAASDGYLVLAPITGKSIFSNCQFPDFQGDPALTDLIHSPEFNQFILAKFKTPASSRIWPQEEEYCSYLDLYLGKISAADRSWGYIWILDAGKLKNNRTNGK